MAADSASCYFLLCHFSGAGSQGVVHDCTGTLAYEVQLEYDEGLTKDDIISYVTDELVNINSRIRTGRKSSEALAERWAANEVLQQSWDTKKPLQEWAVLRQRPTKAEGSRNASRLLVTR
jgi:hypothetical protein